MIGKETVISPEKEAETESSDQTQIASTLSSLSDAQLNVKLAKLTGWKLVEGKWWHDDLGDGPPVNYCEMLGREQSEHWAKGLMVLDGTGAVIVKDFIPPFPLSFGHNP